MIPIVITFEGLSSRDYRDVQYRSYRDPVTVCCRATDFYDKIQSSHGKIKMCNRFVPQESC